MEYNDIKPKMLILKPVTKPYMPEQADVLRRKRGRRDRGGGSGSGSAPPACLMVRTAEILNTSQATERWEAPVTDCVPKRKTSIEDFVKGVSDDWNWILLKNSARKFQDRGLRN